MTSAGQGAVPAAGGPGHVPGGTAKSRQELASDLNSLANDLTAKSRELNRAGPGPENEPDVEGLWRAGLVVVRGYVNRVDRIQADCLRAVAEEPEASDTVDTALEPLRQLERAVVDAIVVINAAFHSLQSPFTPMTRSTCYREAADQLSELAQRCQGLVVHMRGTKGFGEKPAHSS